MRVSNQTNGPVNWTQGGSGDPDPLAAAQQSGQLQGLSATPPFTPSGSAPYSVEFTNANKPDQKANSGKFDDPNATVTLNADWSVTVSP